MRIAVLGANGQVGAELCLLLARQKKVEVVPVCRNKMGSAFLRFNGLACRHGDVADPEQASRLIGDCEVIANLALANLQNYREARDLHDHLIGNVARFSRHPGRHIYFSTMSVYGDARMHERMVFPSLYGQEKARCEKVAKAAGNKYGLDTVVFRLGHVCGELQGITREIRDQIARSPIPVPDLNRASNTVYVATIADAIVKVAAGTVASGTYDLMNKPQWSWKEVFEHEGRQIGVAPTFSAWAETSDSGFRKVFYRSATAGMVMLAGHPLGRKAGSRVLGFLPPEWYHRLKARYSTKAAAAEIAKLIPRQEPMDAVLRKPVGRKLLDVLSPTVDLLRQPEFRLSERDSAAAWSEDLPFFEDGVFKEKSAEQETVMKGR
jgi:nucleoside-diphosphate-sugar epimerase